MKKGFTLLELLIVIGILAILATVVALVLSDIQPHRQARDSQRLSDLRTINSALGLWFASASSTSIAVATTTCTYGSTQVDGTGACQQNQVTTVNGAGWIYGIDFSFVPGGSPLARLPLDPSNGATYHYDFSVTTSGTYEFNANMESARYASGGSADVESNTKDGGTVDAVYEIGTDPALDLM
ncbi:MAG: type II secretion system protein [Patescibacteria group bacterium]|nr:type II secretion system protein [Patescibacteria group bacterium]